jgi:alanine dehydrogenase
VIRLLSRSEVARLLTMEECIDAVERAFAQYAEGGVIAEPGVLGTHVEGGGFHVKTAVLGSGRIYYAAKINANFPGNPARLGLPAIQGVIALFDAVSGQPLSLLDSIQITTLRTAAATAVAARHLAQPNADMVAVYGCGNQGRANLQALASVRPIRRAFALDLDRSRREEFAEVMSRELSISVEATDDILSALRSSPICVTCTPSRQPIFPLEALRPGHFIAAVGADHPEKWEIDPRVMEASRVVTDITAQASTIGDLHHAIAAGLMTPDKVFAELGEVCAGIRPGRTAADEIFVFDSTGTALQDVAASAMVFERASSGDQGTMWAV